MQDEDAKVTRKATASELLTLRLVGAEVTVELGPDAGRSCTVGPSSLVIGTGSGCDLCLSDRLVSRRHVELRAEADGLRVTDLGSLNGTRLGTSRVRDVLLTEDCALALGETTLRVRLQRDGLGVSLSPRRSFGAALAESPGMRHVFDLLEKAAKNDVTVLLEGDSGTGKDVLAHAVHAESSRRQGPFVVVDCGAIPEQLLESELFGHEKGAFTGALQQRAGAFEQAHGGTLFLDEIGELPLEAQPKLLRALESRAFRRVGGSQTVKVDVRVVAATNRRLREAVRRREFREDLFYRLAVVHVAVPRLADRPEDVLPLAESFLRRVTGDERAVLPDDFAKLLSSYAWPGNARELRNVVERFATFDRADPKLLFDPGAATERPGAAPFEGLELLPYHEAKRRVLELFHRAVLPRALERAGGSVPKAAEELGLPRQSLYRMLNQLDEESP
ncbi:MAG: sigma 54-dependent Fis family transcriptional regulator [Polyangiaceae bacterium]|nr:sigma 54-dependent Fis family transcriptional regulator [Polyangiaceae bacterium]